MQEDYTLHRELIFGVDNVVNCWKSL